MNTIQTLAQVCWSGCGIISILGGIQNSTRQSPEQPALVDPALSKAAVGLDNLQRSLPASAIL